MSNDPATDLSIDNYTPTIHKAPYPAIDPKQVTLPTPYTVLILGASRGIGAGIAHSYASASAATLILSSRRVSGLETVAAKCRTLSPLGEKVVVEIMPCDVCDAEAVEKLAQDVKEKFGRLDVVVMNSGYSGDVITRVEDTPVEDFKRCMEVNYVGTFLAAKFLVPLLRATEGGAKTFIAVGSLAAVIYDGREYSCLRLLVDIWMGWWVRLANALGV